MSSATTTIAVPAAEDSLHTFAQAVVRIAAWEPYSWLSAGFSTRLGGESSVYGNRDLNLGWTNADEPANVANNRKRFVAEVVPTAELTLVTIRQFHTNLLRHVDGSNGALSTPDGKAVLRGDALMTDTPGFLLGVQTADCVPVLIADTRIRVVAAVHAGWRGTLARIVERSIGDFASCYGSRQEDLTAAIGPCIGSCCFAVGAEVLPAFQNQFAYGEELFSTSIGSTTTGPQIYLDLVEANRRQLLDAGVSSARITAVGECTVCTCVEKGRPKYFSHRGESGFTGRMMSVIGVVPD